MLKTTLRDQKGFTLIEIIAVLVILGILAAVAVPKYMDLQGEAKQRAAVAQVAEIKGIFSSAWGKAALAIGGEPTYTEVNTYANLGLTGTLGVNGDDIWHYIITPADPTTWQFRIAVTGRGNSQTLDNDYHASGIWSMPTSR